MMYNRPVFVLTGSRLGVVVNASWACLNEVEIIQINGVTVTTPMMSNPESRMICPHRTRTRADMARSFACPVGHSADCGTKRNWMKVYAAITEKRSIDMAQAGPIWK